MTLKISRERKTNLCLGRILRVAVKCAITNHLSARFKLYLELIPLARLPWDFGFHFVDKFFGLFDCEWNPPSLIFRHFRIRAIL